MKKLTGYIGAMIIVFALAGSILAGYALNINGTSTVINDYEKVTDVSGLYAHSDEKKYIEYNPASNYINYRVNENESFVIDNQSDFNGIYYKRYSGTSENTLIWTTSNEHPDGSLYVNGQIIPNSNMGAQSIYHYSILLGPGIDIWKYPPDGTTGYIWIEYNGEVIANTYNIKITYLVENTLRIQYGGLLENEININCPFFFAQDLNGDWAPMVSNHRGYYQNNDVYGLNGTESYWITSWDGKPTFNFHYAVTAWDKLFFVPKKMTYEPLNLLGIEYTESNRVNNYLIERTDTSISINTGTLTLNQVGDNNYFYYNSQNKKQMMGAYQIYNSAMYLDGSYITPLPKPRISIGTPALLPNSQGIYDSNNPIWNESGFHNVKLSTVLQSYNVPQGTTSIKITTNSNEIYNFSNGEFDINLDKNLVYFSYLPNLIRDNGVVPSLNSEMNKKDYLIYDLNTNVCTVYTFDGLARYSGTTDDIGIFYYEDDTTYKSRYVRTSAQGSTSYHFTDIRDRPIPFITVETTQSTPGTLKYSDITKGYVINPENPNETIWDNNYENGNIKLLFRAEDITGTYNNNVTIGDNTISINYTDNRFNVSLNSNTAVDIGTWRNIILDIDLVNGEIYAIPVRTFNSFTNVIMDNTNILIGDMVGAVPTNKIILGTTTNSLLFNVYSTEVFMNTYGVVMVNPTLDINDYFTDLNRFYRLKIYNFAIYGDSMTINGETLAVTDGKMTYNDITLELKDFNVTYADGKVMIGDNHGIIELGDITTTNITMGGNWYFITDLERGYTTQKMIYNWDWGTFIFNNTQFCVFYIGIVAAALIVARKYCNLSIIDYMVLLASIVIALGVQVIA